MNLHNEDFELIDQLFARADQLKGIERRDVCNELDARLHRVLAARSGNTLLVEELDRLHDLMSLLRWWSTLDSEIMEEAYEEHRIIWNALKVQDCDLACQAMSLHMKVASQRNVEHLRHTRSNGLA